MCPGSGSKTPNADPSLKPAFEIIDADRDGKISSYDLLTFYTSFANPSIADENMIHSMISAADSDKNGFVEYEELERVVRGRNRGRFGFGYKEVVDETFKVMDGDGDGRVGCEDLKRWFGEMDTEVSDEEIKEMVGMAGVSVDGFRRILGFDVDQHED